jgi:hypothetical protein
MRIASFVILGVSVAGTVLLGFLWLIGLIAGVGGGLIHLLLVVAILLALFGGGTGLALLLISQNQSRRKE